MKYIYFYNTENTNFEDNYMFGRYGYTIDMYSPVSCAYSDNLTDWNDQTNVSSSILPPIGWGISEDTSIEEFLHLPTTYTAKSLKVFKTKYPEFFI